VWQTAQLARKTSAPRDSLPVTAGVVVADDEAAVPPLLCAHPAVDTAANATKAMRAQSRPAMKTLYRADRLVTRPAGYMRIVTARIGIAIAYSTMFAIAPARCSQPYCS
jgi:hypothetical protein